MMVCWYSVELLKTEFPWDSNSLSETNTMSNMPNLIDKKWPESQSVG